MKKLIALIVLFLVGCASTVENSSKLEYLDKYTLKGEKNLLSGINALVDDEHINVVVEIPTGTNEKWEVDKNSGNVVWEFRDGKPRIVKYLGYVGNYGMVPRTLLSKAEGGDGDPLDVLVIGPSRERGSVVKARVIGILKMLDNGEEDDKVIAVLSDSVFGEIKDINQLQKKFPKVLDIIKLWFTNYKKRMELTGIMNSAEAFKVVKRAAKSFENSCK